jgi:sugar lactone lactonase YvrE
MTILAAAVFWLPNPLGAAEPTGELARKLSDVQFEHYAKVSDYSEGPTWRQGEVFFCAGGLFRVDKERKVHKYLDISPSGTVLRGDGHLLICDDRYKAILDLAPDGKVGVVADRFENEPLRSLNDLTVDARGNVYWTDPDGSTVEKPVGHIYRLRPDGRVDRIATGLAFPNGIEVDPASKYLYLIESQSKKVLRYALPADNDNLDKAEVFFDLGGSGGDGCVFDAAGNFWVADFHRPETGKGRITVLSPEGKVLAYLPVPAKAVSNIAFGGDNYDEIFCTTSEPSGVFRAKVGVKGFPGHPGKALPVSRFLNIVPLRPHADAAALRKLAASAAQAKVDGGKFDAEVRQQLAALVAGLSDPQVRHDAEQLLPAFEQAAARRAHDRPLLAEIKRLGGKAILEVAAPDWLRSIVGDEGLAILSRIVEIELNERTDGHKEPEPKKLSDRVTDDWLKNLADQEQLRRLELSGTAITSAGLVHLKELKSLERLNICLTAVDDRGFEHLAGLVHMRRMVICASKITGSGFRHLQGMKQLESINLHSAPASDAGLEEIGKLTSLKRLEIVHTNVTDDGLKHLAGLVNLQQLHVHGPKATAKALPFLGELKELYQLDVYDRAASNQTLEQIGKLPKLRMLTLPGGIYDDEGMKYLAKVTTLEELSLDSDKVTDASIEHLASLKHLRTLHLGRSRITEIGRKRLQELLPRAMISS